MSKRLASLEFTLLDDTVLNEWFAPMQSALEKVRYSRDRFPILKADFFVLLGCLRQLMGMSTLREQVQSLFHLDEQADRYPLARSTWSDALSSRYRKNILREASTKLVEIARSTLPDRYAQFSELGSRPLLALDATYQSESSHYQPVYPSQGGTDNKKGHMALTTYDLRAGIPVDTQTDTRSVDEMRFVKEFWRQGDWTCVKGAIYVVDRAYIQASYWDVRKSRYDATVITRLKSSFSYEVLESVTVENTAQNEGVLKDEHIQLKSSKQRWRLVTFLSPEGVEYEYLSNDFTLAPGIIAFLYYKRWDEEKYFDNYKPDMANSKAWAKSAVSIEQQALLGLVTQILMRLFLHEKGQQFGFEEDH
ncbi:MAG: transposase, partial [Gammaproteobacteria bacterium]|nr:transposase [Gammaproteobacteria bacterium]